MKKAGFGQKPRPDLHKIPRPLNGFYCLAVFAPVQEQLREMQLRSRFRSFVSNFLKNLFGACFTLPSSMGIPLRPQNLA